MEPRGWQIHLGAWGHLCPVAGEQERTVVRPQQSGTRHLAGAEPRGGGGRCTGSAPHALTHALARARCLPGWIHDDGFDAGRPDIDAEEPGEGPVDQKKPRTAKAIVRLRWMNERNMSGSTI